MANLTSEIAEDRIALAVATMQPTRPEILRATRAHLALAHCGQPLRGDHGRDLFHWSFETDQIQEFWSHSWHGPKGQKIMTVILLNNAFAAAILSTSVSICLGVLYALGYLPVLYFGAEFRAPVSAWSQWGGQLVYFVTLFLWPSRKTIFLDVLCIDQIDTSKKADALLSMGAFLKRSKTLIVFWDSTYSARLWCLFELAAYMHSREGTRPRLFVYPTILGPTVLSVTMALCLLFILVGFVGDYDRSFFMAMIGVFVCLCFYASIHTFRGYFQSIRECQVEMKGFKFEKALCWCCSANHVEHGQEIDLCDRQILRRCITEWFGSTAKFEEQVRVEMEERLSSQLRGLLSYKQFVLAMVPFLWGIIDIYSASWYMRWRLKMHHEGDGFIDVFRGLAYWLGVGPLLMLIAMRLAQCFPRRASKCVTRQVDALITLAIVLVIAGTLVAILVAEPYIWTLMDALGVKWRVLEIGSAVFALIFILLAWICFCCCAPAKLLVRSEEAPTPSKEAPTPSEETPTPSKEALAPSEEASSPSDADATVIGRSVNESGIELQKLFFWPR